MKKENLKINNITLELTPFVKALLKARAIAEVLREKIDAIKLEVLQENVFLDVLSRKFKNSTDKQSERILEVKKDYFMSEEDFFIYNNKVQEKEEKLGLRNGIKEGLCPALVAESTVRDIERSIAEVFGILIEDDKFLDNLYTCRDTLKKSKEFFDLVIKLVVNHPSFIK